MDTEKTIKEWLQMLNEPERSQALKNMMPYGGEDKRSTLAYALHGAFSWEPSPEKHRYWREIHDRLASGKYVFDKVVATRTKSVDELFFAKTSMKSALESQNEPDSRILICSNL